MCLNISTQWYSFATENRYGMLKIGILDGKNDLQMKRTQQSFIFDALILMQV